MPPCSSSSSYPEKTLSSSLSHKKKQKKTNFPQILPNQTKNSNDLIQFEPSLHFLS